jgi:hypothetical protein
MSKFSRSLLSATVAAGILGLPMVMGGEAYAQATCRTKCVSAEQACLKRTSNKGQCGRIAATCIAKCK